MRAKSFHVKKWSKKNFGLKNLGHAQHDKQDL